MDFIWPCGLTYEDKYDTTLYEYWAKIGFQPFQHSTRILTKLWLGAQFGFPDLERRFLD